MTQRDQPPITPQPPLPLEMGSTSAHIYPALLSAGGTDACCLWGAAQAYLMMNTPSAAPKALTPVSQSEGTPRKCPADPDNLILAIKECPWGPEEETTAPGWERGRPRREAQRRGGMKGSRECAPGSRQGHGPCGLRSSAPGLPTWEVNRGPGGWKGGLVVPDSIKGGCALEWGAHAWTWVWGCRVASCLGEQVGHVLGVDGSRGAAPQPPSRPALSLQGEGRDPGEAEALAELRRGQRQQHQADSARVVPQQDARLPGEPGPTAGTPARGGSGHRPPPLLFPWPGQEPQSGAEG